LLLKLDIDEANIDCLESASCEEGFATKEHEYQESYRTSQRSTNYPRDTARRRKSLHLDDEPRRRAQVA
jgi:hypothetical protein